MTKWRMELPEGFACPILPTMGPIFEGRGLVISVRLAKRFGSRTQNCWVELLPLGLHRTDYLNTEFDHVVSV